MNHFTQDQGRPTHCNQGVSAKKHSGACKQKHETGTAWAPAWRTGEAGHRFGWAVWSTLKLTSNSWTNNKQTCTSVVQRRGNNMTQIVARHPVQNTTVEQLLRKIICAEDWLTLSLSCLAIASCSSLSVGNVPPIGGGGAFIAAQCSHGSSSMRRTVFKFGARSITELRNIVCRWSPSLNPKIWSSFSCHLLAFLNHRSVQSNKS